MLQRTFLPLVLIFVACGLLYETVAEVTVVHECPAHRDECTAYAVFADGARAEIVAGVDPGRSWFKTEGTIGHYGFSLGSPLNYTYFIDPETKKISVPFENQIAFDSWRRIVAHPGEPVGNAIVIQRMFSPPGHGIRVVRDFSPSVSVSGVAKGSFDRDGDFELSFMRGPNFEEVTEVIPISDAMLDAPLN